MCWYFWHMWTRCILHWLFDCHVSQISVFEELQMFNSFIKRPLSFFRNCVRCIFHFCNFFFSWSHLTSEILYWIISRSSTNNSKLSSSKYVLVLVAVSSIHSTRWHFICKVLAHIIQQGSSRSWQNNVIGIPWWMIHTSPLLWFGTKCIQVI